MAHKAASDLLPAASDLLPDLELTPANDDTPDRVSRVRRRDALPDHINITKSSLSRLVCPPGKKEAFFWDKDIPGLALRAYPSGKRVWICQYRDQHGRTRRVPLGSVAVIDPAKAREKARETLRAVADGGNPAVDRKAARQAATVGSLVDAYLQDAALRLKPNTLDQSERNLRKYAKDLREEPIKTVDRAMLFRLRDKIAKDAGKAQANLATRSAKEGEKVQANRAQKRSPKDAGKVQANRVLATLSAMWTWGLKAGLVTGENPAAFVPRFPETARERVLSDDEIRTLWRATASGKTFDRIVRLTLLSGCRRQEVGSMEWSEIDEELWTVPASRMKGGQAHEVPLSALALAQLPPKVGGAVFDSFDGWTAGKRRLDEAMTSLRPSDAPALPWGLHDLRRTFSTMMNERGLAEPHIIEACLAHAGVKSGVAGVYNRAAYRDAKRAAFQAWAALVSEIAERE